MIGEVALALLLFFMVLLVIKKNACDTGELSMDAQDAVRHLLNAGACVELKKWHIYKTKNGKYGIMQFDDKSNLVPDTDQFFVDAELAISTFVKKTAECKTC